MLIFLIISAGFPVFFNSSEIKDSSLDKFDDLEKVEREFLAPLTIGAGGVNCPISKAIITDIYKESFIEKKKPVQA